LDAKHFPLLHYLETAPCKPSFVNGGSPHQQQESFVYRQALSSSIPKGGHAPYESFYGCRVGAQERLNIVGKLCRNDFARTSSPGGCDVDAAAPVFKPGVQRLTHEQIKQRG
jgi:hypothetical protein